MARARDQKATIHYHRMRCRLTQQELAGRMGIHRVTLAKLECFRLFPGKELLRKLAGELDWAETDVLAEYTKHVPVDLRRTA